MNMIDTNLTLTGYGVTLRRLTHDKIEMLRQWRNDPKIQQYMEYREYITPEMQESWFNKINNDRNYYFIIEYDGNEIGLINLKDYDAVSGTGETGMFIYDDYYLNTDVVYRASFVFGDFLWDTLLMNSIYIHVMQDNKRAIRYNKFWGYQLCENQGKEKNQKYYLTREGHEQNLSKEMEFRKLLD